MGFLLTIRDNFNKEKLKISIGVILIFFLLWYLSDGGDGTGISWLLELELSSAMHFIPVLVLLIAIYIILFFQSYEIKKIIFILFLLIQFVNIGLAEIEKYKKGNR
jgi:hypothetical protein